MEEFNLRLGMINTFNERNKIMPLTMEKEQELYYDIIRKNIEIAGQKWEKQRDVESECLASKQKKFMEKIILHRVKSIKLSDGLCVPNFNYISVEVEYYNSNEFPNEKLKNLKLSEIDEVVDKIYELPHYQTFHTDDCSLKKYKIVHLLDDNKDAFERLTEIGYFTTH